MSDGGCNSVLYPFGAGEGFEKLPLYSVDAQPLDLCHFTGRSAGSDE